MMTIFSPLRDVEFLGPSGVGKTTLIKSLDGCLPVGFVHFREAIKQIQEGGRTLPIVSRMDRALFDRLMATKFDAGPEEIDADPHLKSAHDFFSKNLSLHLSVPLHTEVCRTISDDGIFHNFSDAILKLENDEALNDLASLLHLVSLSGSFDYILENLRRRHVETPGMLHDWLGRYQGDVDKIRNQIEAYRSRQAEIERRAQRQGSRILRLNAEDGLARNRSRCIQFLEELCLESNPLYLSKEEFYRAARRIGNGHWASQPLQHRWDYHRRALEIVKEVGISRPQDVLEIGTVGMQLVKGSDTLDRDAFWDFPGKNPTFLHDARDIPWPLKKKYKVIIALRVFQYLVPQQAAAFREAKRLCEHLIVVVPEGEAYQPQGLEGSKGITLSQFCEFNDGIPPLRFENTALGKLYYWKFIED